jgi:SAM-dependent methyltransferase
MDAYMDTRAIVSMKNDVAAKYGPWTAHNVHLQDDVYTIGPFVAGDEVKLRRIVQVVFDHAGGTVEGLRVLDLACLEGLYAIEFARHGANCLAIEGREANVEKARFVKRVLSLDNLELVQDDVRNLSVEKYGRFDIVLCLGILYHLDAPDVFSFIQRLGDVCAKICIVDTRITLHPKTRCSYNGETYFGTKGQEHDPGDSNEVKVARLFASLDNIDNFWLSRPTLCNALSRAGFTSVYECNVPTEPQKPVDRVTFVAIKGKPIRLLGAPLMAARPTDHMPERPRRENSVAFGLLRKASHLLPRNTRTLCKRLLGIENKLT